METKKFGILLIVLSGCTPCFEKPNINVDSVSENYRIEQTVRKTVYGNYVLETNVWQIDPIDILASNEVRDGYEKDYRDSYMKSLYYTKQMNDSVKRAQYDLAKRFIKRHEEAISPLPEPQTK